MNAGALTEEQIEAVVIAFYARVREDRLLGPVFNDAIDDWPEHLVKLQSFWSSVMLGTGRYKGRPMPAHVRHADRITPESFQHWLALWRETTTDLLPPRAADALQDKAARIAESLSLGIQFYHERASPRASCDLMR